MLFFTIIEKYYKIKSTCLVSYHDDWIVDDDADDKKSQ